jgi:hypothetical protein
LSLVAVRSPWTVAMAESTRAKIADKVLRDIAV